MGATLGVGFGMWWQVRGRLRGRAGAGRAAWPGHVSGRSACRLQAEWGIRGRGWRGFMQQQQQPLQLSCSTLKASLIGHVCGRARPARRRLLGVVCSSLRWQTGCINHGMSASLCLADLALEREQEVVSVTVFLRAGPAHTRPCLCVPGCPARVPQLPSCMRGLAAPSPRLSSDLTLTLNHNPQGGPLQGAGSEVRGERWAHPWAGAQCDHGPSPRSARTRRALSGVRRRGGAGHDSGGRTCPLPRQQHYTLLSCPPPCAGRLALACLLAEATATEVVQSASTYVLATAPCWLHAATCCNIPVFRSLPLGWTARAQQRPWRVGELSG